MQTTQTMQFAKLTEGNVRLPYFPQTCKFEAHCQSSSSTLFSAIIDNDLVLYVLRDGVCKASSKVLRSLFILDSMLTVGMKIANSNQNPYFFVEKTPLLVVINIVIAGNNTMYLFNWYEHKGNLLSNKLCELMLCVNESKVLHNNTINSAQLNQQEFPTCANTHDAMSDRFSTDTTRHHKTINEIDQVGNNKTNVEPFYSIARPKENNELKKQEEFLRKQHPHWWSMHGTNVFTSKNRSSEVVVKSESVNYEEQLTPHRELREIEKSDSKRINEIDSGRRSKCENGESGESCVHYNNGMFSKCECDNLYYRRVELNFSRCAVIHSKTEHDREKATLEKMSELSSSLPTKESEKCSDVQNKRLAKIHCIEFVTENEVCLLLSNEVLLVRFEVVEMEEKQITNANEECSTYHTEKRWVDFVLWKLHGCFTKLAVEPANLYIALMETSTSTVTVVFPWYKKEFRKSFTNSIMEIPFLSREYIASNSNLVEVNDTSEEFECKLSWLQLNNNVTLCVHYAKKCNQGKEYSFKERVENKSTCNKCINADDTADTKRAHSILTKMKTIEYSVNNSCLSPSNNEIIPTIYFYQFKTHVPIHTPTTIWTRHDIVSAQGVYRNSNTKREKEVKFTDNTNLNNTSSLTEHRSSVDQAQFNDAFHALCEPLTTKSSKSEQQTTREGTSPIAPLSSSSAVIATITTATAVDTANEPNSNGKGEFMHITSPTHVIQLPQSLESEQCESTEWELNNTVEVEFERSEIVPFLLGEIELECSESNINVSFDNNEEMQKEREQACETPVELHWYTQVVPLTNVENELSINEKCVYTESGNQSLQLLHVHSTGLVYTSNYSISQNADSHNNFVKQRSAHGGSYTGGSNRSSGAKLLTPLCELYGYINSMLVLSMPRVNSVEIGHAFANQHTCHQTNCTYCVLLTFEKTLMKVLTIIDVSSGTFEIVHYLNYGKGREIESICAMEELNLSTVGQEWNCVLHSPHINLVAVLYKEYHKIPMHDCNKSRITEQPAYDKDVTDYNEYELMNKEKKNTICDKSCSSNHNIATEKNNNNSNTKSSSNFNTKEQNNNCNDNFSTCWNNNKSSNNDHSSIQKSKFTGSVSNHYNLIDSGGIMLFVQQTVASQTECTLLSVAPFTNESLENVESVICCHNNLNYDNNNNSNNKQSVEAETETINFTEQSFYYSKERQSQCCCQMYFERALQYFYHDGNSFLFAIKCTTFNKDAENKIDEHGKESCYSHRCLCQMQTLNVQREPLVNKGTSNCCSAYTPTATRVIILKSEKINENELYCKGNLCVLRTRHEVQSENLKKTPIQTKSCTPKEHESIQNEFVNDKMNCDYFKQTDVNVHVNDKNTTVNNWCMIANSNDITSSDNNKDNKQHLQYKLTNQSSQLSLRVFTPLLPADGVELECFAEFDKEYGEQCIKMWRVLETKVVLAANHDTLVGVIVQGIYNNQKKGEYFDEKLFLFALLAFQSLKEADYEFKLEAVYNSIHSFDISELGEVLLIDRKASSITRCLRCFPTFGHNYYYITVESWDISEHSKNASNEKNRLCSSTLIPWQPSIHSRREQFVQLLYATQGINHLYYVTIPFTTKQHNYLNNVNALQHKNVNSMMESKKINTQYHPDVIMQLVGIGEWRLIKAIFAKIEEAVHKCMWENEQECVEEESTATRDNSTKVYECCELEMQKQSEEEEREHEQASNGLIKTQTKESKYHEKWSDASHIIHHLLRPHQVKMEINHSSNRCNVLEPETSSFERQSASSTAPTPTPIAITEITTNSSEKKFIAHKTNTDQHMCGVVKIDELTTTQIIKLIMKNDTSDIVSSVDNNNIIYPNVAVGYTLNSNYTVDRKNVSNNYNYFNSHQRQEKQLCKHGKRVNLIDVFGRNNTSINNSSSSVTFDRLSCTLTQFSLYGLTAETQLSLLCIVNALAQSVTLAANVDEAGARFFFFHKLRLIRTRLHLSDHMRESTCSTNHYRYYGSEETLNAEVENKYANKTNDSNSNNNNKLYHNNNNPVHEVIHSGVCHHAYTSQIQTEAHTLVDFVRSKLPTRIIPQYHFVWALLSDSQSVLLTQLLESMTSNMPTSTQLASTSTLLQHNYPTHDDTDNNLSHITLSYTTTKTWSWELVEMTGIPYWVTNGETLRHIAEQIARCTYKTQLEHKTMANENEDRHQRAIEASALMFVVSRRTSTLAALCKVNGNGKSGGMSTGGNKLAAFFSRNFEESRHQAAASANGYAALGKGKHEYAAAFFILAHDHRSAIQVLLQRCHNPNLALFVLRTVLSTQPEHTPWRYSLQNTCSVSTPPELSEKRESTYSYNDSKTKPTCSLMESELRWYKYQRSSESAECGRANLWEEFCIDWLMGSTHAKIRALQLLTSHPTGLPEILSVTRYIRDNVSGVAEHCQEYLSTERELVCCARLGRFCLSRGLIMTAMIHYSDAQELLWQLSQSAKKEENAYANNNKKKNVKNDVNKGILSENHNTSIDHATTLRNRPNMAADINTGILHFTGFDSEDDDDDDVKNDNNNNNSGDFDNNSKQETGQDNEISNNNNNKECETATKAKIANVLDNELLASTDNNVDSTENRLTAYMKGVVQTELTYAMQQMRFFDKDSICNVTHDKHENKLASSPNDDDVVVNDDSYDFDQKVCFALSTMFVNHLVSATPLANVSDNLTLVLSIASEWWSMNVQHDEEPHARGKKDENVPNNSFTLDAHDCVKEHSQENKENIFNCAVSCSNAANNDFYTLFIVILFVIFESVAVEHAHFLLANALMHVLEQREVIMRGVTFKHTCKLEEHTTILHPVAAFFSTLQECYQAAESMYEATIQQQEQELEESVIVHREDSNNGIMYYGQSTTSKAKSGDLYNNKNNQPNTHNKKVNEEENEKDESDNDDNAARSTKFDFETLHRNVWETITAAATAAPHASSSFISEINVVYNNDDSNTCTNVANNVETKAPRHIESKEISGIFVRGPCEETDKAILLEEFSLLLKLKLLKVLHDVWNREKERIKYSGSKNQHTECSITDYNSDYSALPTIHEDTNYSVDSIYVRHKSLFHLLLASLTLYVTHELNRSIDVHCTEWLQHRELCAVAISSLSSFVTTLNGVFVETNRKENKCSMQLCTKLRVELSKLYKSIANNDVELHKTNAKFAHCFAENTNESICTNQMKKEYATDNKVKSELSQHTDESDNVLCRNDIMIWDAVMCICESNYANHWLEEEKSMCNKKCVLFNTHVIDARITRLTKEHFYARELHKLLTEMIVNSNTENQTVCTDTLSSTPSTSSTLPDPNVNRDNNINIVETCNVSKSTTLSHSSSPVIATSGSFPWHSLQNFLESSESSQITNCLLAIMERFYLIRHHTHQSLRRLLLSLSFQVNITSSISYKNRNVADENNIKKSGRESNCKLTCTLPRVITIDRLILGQRTHSITTIGFDNASCDSIVWSSDAGTHVSHSFREVLAHDNETVLRRQSAERSATILSFSESLAQQQHAFSSLSSMALVDKTNKKRAKLIQSIKEGHNVLQTRPLTGMSANAQPSPHPHLPFFLTTARDHFVDLYSFASAECVSTFICPSLSTHPITQAMYTVHGEHFAVGLSDGSISVWHFRASATPATPAVYVPSVFITNGVKNLVFCDQPFLNRRHYYNSVHSLSTESDKLVIAAVGLVQEWSNDIHKTTSNIIGSKSCGQGGNETRNRNSTTNCREQQQQQISSSSQHCPMLPLSSSLSSSASFPAPHSPRSAHDTKMSGSLTSPAFTQTLTSRNEMVNVDAKPGLNKNLVKPTIIGEVVLISICSKQNSSCVANNASVESPLSSTNINVKPSCDKSNTHDDTENSCTSNSNYGTIIDNVNKSESIKNDSVGVEHQVKENEYEATIDAKCALPFTPEFCVYIKSLDALFIVSSEGYIATYEIKGGKLTIIGEINIECLLRRYCEVDTAATSFSGSAFADKNATNIVRAYITDYFANRASPIKITALAISSYDDLIAIGTSIGISFMLTLEEVEEYMKEVDNWNDNNSNINADTTRCAPSSLRLSSTTIMTQPLTSEMALRKSNRGTKTEYGITQHHGDIKINIPTARELYNRELSTSSSTVTSTSNSIFSTVALLFTKGSNKYKTTEVEFLTHSAQPANCTIYYSILLRSTIIQITPMLNAHCGIYSLCFAPSVLLAGLHDGKVIAASLVPNALRQFITSGIAAVK